MTERSALAAALVALTSIGIVPAHPTIIAGLYIPGVPGESLDRDVAGMRDVTSISVGVADPVCSGLTVMKHVDWASPVLPMDALSAVSCAMLRLSVKTADERPHPFIA